MKGKICKSTFYLALGLGSGAVVPVSAQTAPAPAPAQAPAAAANSEAPAVEEAPAMEEVVVTARRIEERAQDVPISMTVFNQQQLTERNVTSGADLATYTPSLSTNTEFGSEGTSFAIRGFRQEIDTTASVAVYFADVVAPRGSAGGTNTGDGAGPGSFFDLQNVQVLKGPQGTLFGRNTDGGAVLLVPQKPTSQREGYVDAGYGNHDMMHVQGVFNLPVSDHFRMRFGMDHENRDGYMKNISGIGPDAFNDIDYTSARVSAVWDITPSLENYTIASFVNSDHNGVGQKLFACNPGVGLGSLACPQFAKDSAQDFFTVENDLPFAKAEMQQWQLINTTTWTQSDTLTVKNIASYAQLTNKAYNDLFGTNFQVPAIPALGLPAPTSIYINQVVTAPGHKLNDMADMTEELRFQGNLLSNRLIWQSGLYAEFNEPQSDTGVTSGSGINCTDIFNLKCVDLEGLGAGAQVGTVNYQVGRSRFHDYGIYEQASYSLTDSLKLTEGLRYTMDSAQAHYDEALYYFSSPLASPPSVPSIYCAAPSQAHSYISGNGPAPSVDSCKVSLKKDSQAPTWLLGLDYKLTDNNLLYIKYARGYRQGSVSPTAPEGYQTFNPEKVDTYELGSKNSFNNVVRGTFNVAAFYNDFRDQQIGEGFLCPATTPLCGVSGNLGIVNAGKSRMYGLETDSTISPYKGLTMAISYAYLNTKLVSLPVAPFPANSPYSGDNGGGVPNAPVATTNVGGEIALTPKNKATATATYVLPLASSVGKVSVAGNYSYQSGMIQASYGATPYYKTGGYGLTNLNLDWTAIAGSRFDAGLFATNVFDQKYYTFVAGLYNQAGFESADVGEPRMFGGRVRMNFGN